eukprot:g1711.t1
MYHSRPPQSFSRKRRIKDFDDTSSDYSSETDGGEIVSVQKRSSGTSCQASTNKSRTNEEEKVTFSQSIDNDLEIIETLDEEDFSGKESPPSSPSTPKAKSRPSGFASRRGHIRHELAGSEADRLARKEALERAQEQEERRRREKAEQLKREREEERKRRHREIAAAEAERKRMEELQREAKRREWDMLEDQRREKARADAEREAEETRAKLAAERDAELQRELERQRERDEKEREWEKEKIKQQQEMEKRWLDEKGEMEKRWMDEKREREKVLIHEETARQEQLAHEAAKEREEERLKWERRWNEEKDAKEREWKNRMELERKRHEENLAAAAAAATATEERVRAAEQSLRELERKRKEAEQIQKEQQAREEEEERVKNEEKERERERERQRRLEEEEREKQRRMEEEEMERERERRQRVEEEEREKQRRMEEEERERERERQQRVEEEKKMEEKEKFRQTLRLTHLEENPYNDSPLSPRTRQAAAAASSRHNSERPMYSKGDYVEVQYGGWETFYPATVTDVCKDDAGTWIYSVLYTNSETESNVTESYMRAWSGDGWEQELPSPPSKGTSKSQASEENKIDGEIHEEIDLWHGGYLWKVPYRARSTPKRRWFQLAQPVPSEPPVLLWYNSRKREKKPRELKLVNVFEIREGQTTRAFKQQISRRGSDCLPPSRLCFSLIANTRTVDLSASSPFLLRAWVDGLKKVIGRPTTALYSENSNNGSQNSLHPANGMPHNNLLEGDDEEAKLRYWGDHLFHCAQKREVRQVEALLDEGCPVDLMDPDGGSGDTVLLLACRFGYTEIAELCLSRGAKFDPHPEYGQTALQCAVAAGQYDCTRLLLETAAVSGADRFIVSLEDEHKDTPLHIAAKSEVASGSGLLGGVHGEAKHKSGIVELLLKHHADYSLMDGNGRTAFHVACLAGKFENCQTMLKFGAHSVFESGDNDGRLPLHCAAMSGNHSIVELLIKNGANIEILDGLGKTAAQLANEKGFHECEIALRKANRNAQFLHQVFKKKEKLGTSLFAGLQLATETSNKNYSYEYEALPAPRLMSTSVEENYPDYVEENYPAEEYNYEYDNTNYEQEQYYDSELPPPQEPQATETQPGTPENWDLWELAYTSEGHPYYYNVTTGVSQWEDPRGLTAEELQSTEGGQATRFYAAPQSQFYGEENYNSYDEHNSSLPENESKRARIDTGLHSVRDRWHPLVPHLKLGNLSAGPAVETPKAEWEVTPTAAPRGRKSRRRSRRFREQLHYIE